ncbi:RsmG family class I SAM-dependent methyltransferase [uncultured Desulfovibrio sp.]|uniref:16S rRNA (guanine(527)-N(7))-methyltransferase RsmG n=1 Tax=uncultured Desulfovibrio sp. TaxID=167968 RepID=UPI0026025002|nr:RsmG family class I SAM-dependent methyltransferase [uncultured Desulfovibrio sp.]
MQKRSSHGSPGVRPDRRSSDRHGRPRGREAAARPARSTRTAAAPVLVPPAPEALAGCARQAGLTIPEQALQPLGIYLTELIRWNSVMNLVGAHDWREALANLAGDSFHLAAFLADLPLPEAPLHWDLGSGAGLPGIPLRMVWERGDYWLVEAREKRALFLSRMLCSLRLPRTHVHRGRVEHFFGTQPRGADCVISRAFMPPEALLPLLAPHLAPQGLVILLCNRQPAALPPGWERVRHRAYGVRRSAASAAGETRCFLAVRLHEAGALSPSGPSTDIPSSEV